MFALVPKGKAKKYTTIENSPFLVVKNFVLDDSILRYILNILAHIKALPFDFFFR